MKPKVKLIGDSRLYVGEKVPGLKPMYKRMSCEKESSMNDRLKKQARDAIEFLGEHPAIAPDALFGRALYFSIQDVCKRGYDRIVADLGVDIWPSSKHADKFKAEFEKEYKELEESYKDCPKDKMLKIEKRLAKISVPYKKLYGEPWKYDHTEYWGEMSFFIYHGKPKDWMKERSLSNPYSWQAYGGLDMDFGARTFEELLIRMARKFKRQFGDFKADDFLTKKEKENHRKEESFFRIKLGKRPMYRLKRNPKYIEVGPAELNHRWAKWYLTTPYGKEHWGDSEELRKILR